MCVRTCVCVCVYAQVFCLFVYVCVCACVVREFTSKEFVLSLFQL